MGKEPLDSQSFPVEQHISGIQSHRPHRTQAHHMYESGLVVVSLLSHVYVTAFVLLCSHIGWSVCHAFVMFCVTVLKIVACESWSVFMCKSFFTHKHIFFLCFCIVCF